MNLIFLESSDIGVRYSAEAAKALGYRPIFLCNLEHYHGDPRRQLNDYLHYQCDTSSLDSILEAIRAHEIKDIAAITSFADKRLKVACDAARALRVAGLDPIVTLLKDKGTVARMIPEYSPEGIVIGPSELPTETLYQMLRKYDRLIVKPVEGAGGAGIFFLTNKEDVDALPARFANEPPHATWVAQQLIDGPLVSAEGYVCEGRPRVLGFAGRRKIGATETGADFPIDDRLPSEVRARALEAIQALVSRSGFRNGYFHIEFLCTHDSCVMIDANVGRIGGGAIAEQIALAYGLRPEQVFRHVLELSLFGFEEPRLYRDNQARRETYAILYGLKEGGKVDGVWVPPGTLCFHTQIVADGNRVSPMGQDDWSWVGILCGETHETWNAIERIRIRVGEQEFAPCF